jgi:hypothetical protein
MLNRPRLNYIKSSEIVAVMTLTHKEKQKNIFNID